MSKKGISILKTIIIIVVLLLLPNSGDMIQGIITTIAIIIWTIVLYFEIKDV